MNTTAEKTNRPASANRQPAHRPMISRAMESGSFFRPAQPFIQPKLEVSSPEDAHEHEAEQMADHVMRMPTSPSPPPPQTTTASTEELQRAPETEEEEIAPKLESTTDSKSISASRHNVACGMGTGNLQPAPAPRGTFDATTKTLICRSPMPLFRSDVIQRAGRGPPNDGARFESQLQQTRGTGEPLPASTRAFMESRFQSDFSAVRIHTGGTAQSLSKSIHAQAFTHGGDIYFNSGKYDVDSSSGKTLLAHELTHTIQQGASPQNPSASKTPSSPSSPTNASRKIQRQAVPQLTAAVAKAKGEEGKVNANEPGPDGNRTGWQRLLEYFKTSMGPEAIVSGSGGGGYVPGTVSESVIKTKSRAMGQVANQPPDVQAMRDAMPSWCGIFVFWALNKSGVPMPKWKLGGPAIKPEAAYPPGHTPTTGDIAYRNANSHYAIVEKATGGSASADVTTVNGNTAGEDNLGGQVQTRSHKMTEWTGFFNPLVLMEGSLRDVEDPDAKPKTLRELRRELFRVDRQKESALQTSQPTPQKPVVQPKSQPSPPAAPEPLVRTEEEEEPESARGPPQISRTLSRSVQRSWLGDAWDAVSGFASEAASFIEQGLDAAKIWLLEQVRDFVREIPGYQMLSFILGYDPITNAAVERNGRNLLYAGLDIVPGGDLFRIVIERIGAVEDLATYLDGRISDMTRLTSGLSDRFDRFWAGLTLERIGDPQTVMNEVAEIFRSTMEAITSFITNAAIDFLEMIKRIMIREIVTFIRNQIPRLYPLLCVALGHDPVTNEEVARNGTNILNAVLEVSEEGREQRRQMQETGTFQRIAGFIDRGIAVFTTAYTQLRAAFTNIWNFVTIDALVSPIETFNRIYDQFSAPVTLVTNYIVDVATEILRVIKDVLMARLAAWARTVRGYTLVTVIIGRDPFTDAPVARNAENIIHGFMGLMEGGEEQFNQMKESGAIDRTTARIEAAIARLNMTPAYIVDLFISLWNSFSLSDLANPIAAFQRIIDRFGEPIGRLIAFVIEIVKIVIEVILQVMNFPFDLIGNIITKAMQAFQMIKQDPIGFIKNLLRSIKQGFIQFFDNILSHLLNGVTGWLMSELRDAGVPTLSDFSLRGVITWILAVLGISMEKIWEKLAAHPRIGPERVARIRSMIDRLEGIWTFIKDVQERGMAAIWDKIQEQLSNLWDTVLDAVKNWIMEKIVTAVVTKLLSMLDPTGIMAVINSAIAIYRAVQSFIRYITQMLQVVNSFVEGVVEIAEGNITRAANALENAMDRAMPVVIGFLANQVGLGGVGQRIGEMIERVREMVDRALTWLVNRAVDTGFAIFDRLMAMGRSAVAAVRGFVGRLLGLEKNFTDENGGRHRFYFAAQGSSADLMLNPPPPVRFVTWVSGIEVDTSTPAGRTRAQKKTRALEVAREIDAEKARANPSPSTPQQEAAEERRAELIRQKLDELSALTGPLFAGMRPDCSRENSGLTLGALRGGKYGATMAAATLTNIRMPDGSAPSVSLHESFNVINQRRNQGGSYYVLGHLLNHNLGGTGRDWRNLTPLTREANSAHERIAESRVKNAVTAGNIVHYRVTAEYGRSAPTSSDPTIQNIMNHEVDVPQRLICEAEMITPPEASTGPERRASLVPAGTVIENNITQSPADYDLQGLRHETVYLDSGNIAKISTIEGVNTQFAQKIKDAYRDKLSVDETRFGSFNALADYVTSEDVRFTDLQKQKIRSFPDYVRLYEA